MAGISSNGRRWTVAGAGTVGAVGAGLVILTAPVAAADPATPAEPGPAPLELIEPAAVPATEAAPVSLEAPADLEAPAQGVSHLPSPDSLPPGTTQTAPDSGRLGYLRDLWHAVRTQDVTMTDAFLLFAQRPVDTKSIAPGSMSPQPQLPSGAALPEQAQAPVLEAEGADPALPLLPPEADAPDAAASS